MQSLNVNQIIPKAKPLSMYQHHDSSPMPYISQGTYNDESSRPKDQSDIREEEDSNSFSSSRQPKEIKLKNLNESPDMKRDIQI